MLTKLAISFALANIIVSVANNIIACVGIVCSACWDPMWRSTMYCHFAFTESVVSVTNVMEKSPKAKHHDVTSG